MEPLPHVVGKITNISRNIGRSLVSLKSEVKRRQQLFAEYGVNNIEKYQRAYRNGEAKEMLPTIRKFFPDDKIEFIKAPGTLEGGDVMMVGDHFYVGRSARTNEEGIRQFIEILERHGLSGSEVPLEHVLHLKTGVNYIENGNMLVSGEFVDKPDFAKFNKIVIPEDEEYAANCIWVNGKVIVPSGYPTVEKLVREAGYEVLLTDTSEYRKLDGGLSCLSLRF